MYTPLLLLIIPCCIYSLPGCFHVASLQYLKPTVSSVRYRSLRSLPVRHGLIRHEKSSQAFQFMSMPSEARGQNNNNHYDTFFITLKQIALPVTGFTAYCLGMTFLIISLEDIMCSYTLPSRHRTELLSAQRQQSSSWKREWGQSTMYGMGFGLKERLLLQSLNSDNIGDEDALLDNLQSYNEIMLKHRTVTVPQWRSATASNSVSGANEAVPGAIHTIIKCYQAIKEMQQLSYDYQWNSVREGIQSPPLTDLSQSAAILRNYNNLQRQSNFENVDDIIGFDWGSCSWRHCGAVADIQEALDELGYLLGVLEPYEAVFCFDIAERALRDIMTVIPWQLANIDDATFWKEIPEYASKVKIKGENDESDDFSLIDKAYLQALQELRVD